MRIPDGGARERSSLRLVATVLALAFTVSAFSVEPSYACRPGMDPTGEQCGGR